MRSIVKRMVKLFRMYRMTRLVEKETKRKYKHSSDPWEYKYPNQDTIRRKFKVFSFNEHKRAYIFDKTLASALDPDNGYILKDIKGSAEPYYYLHISPGKGERLTEGMIFGFIRELVKVNNFWLTILIALAALVVSILAYLKKSGN